MIDITKPVKLRNGLYAEIWKMSDGYIWGRYVNGGTWYPMSWKPNGSSAAMRSGLDLINVTEDEEI